MTIADAPTSQKSWVSRALTIALNAAIIFAGIFFAIATPSYQTLAGTDRLPFYLSILSFLALSTASVLLIWRRTLAVPILIGASITAIVLPGTPFVALVALATVIKQRSWQMIIWLTLLVATATVVSGMWDLALGKHSLAGQSSGNDPFTPTDGSIASVVGIMIFGTLLWMWPFVTWGFIARALADRNRARNRESQAEQAAQDLRDAATTQAARHEVARELHDTIAAKLSTVSLHAGALEAQAAENPELLDSARVVRAAVQGSIEDLRHVVSQLRDPDPNADYQKHGYALSDLDELVDEAHRSGERVRSRISLSDFSNCDPAIAHACYRIVQESLTNARKHAPGAPLSVTVQGDAANGIFVRVHTEVLEGGSTTVASGAPAFADPAPTVSAGPATAAMRAADASAASPGHGLIGMRERAQQLGGSLTAELAAELATDGGFRVDCWLPWVSAEAATPQPGQLPA